MFEVRPVELADSPEILAAADWWCARLTGYNKQDAGDAKLNFASSLISSYQALPSSAHVRVFRECLITALSVHCAESWKPDQPNWGSGCRCVGCDYHPDYVLHEALVAARIDNGDLILPIKTSMWINPGEVKVSVGYRGKDEIIYKKD